MSLESIRADVLDHPGIRHAFFTRRGGVSEGIYASLNGGVGSRDDATAVAENHRRMTETLAVAPGRMIVPFQTHSTDVMIIGAADEAEPRPRVDGLVTREPGLALGVTGADCGIVLLADPQARVVGAVHAGWKGALDGVLGATVDAMVSIGATPSAITAVLGPAIAQASYEVGAEFVARFEAVHATYARFFQPSRRERHAMFDLHGFICARLSAAGVGYVGDLGLDTYADETRFFSYRRATHRGEPDYGRLIAAIALVD